METVASTDGTLIAYEQSGTGPYLVLVHGTGTIRASWAPIFARDFTVVAMDRRGRGDSGDGPAYSIAREVEDVAAVVNELDPPMLLFGHSFGALCALEAATRTDKLAGLVLYEPVIYGEGEEGVTEEQLERLETLLASGDREGVVKTLYAEIVGMSPHEMEGLMASPTWPSRVATAPTIPREMRAEAAYRLPGDRLAGLTTPILLLLGGDSPAVFSKTTAALKKILPNAQTVVMPGQQHIAMYAAPDLLVGAVLDFWRSVG